MINLIVSKSKMKIGTLVNKEILVTNSRRSKAETEKIFG